MKSPLVFALGALATMVFTAAPPAFADPPPLTQVDKTFAMAAAAASIAVVQFSALAEAQSRNPEVVDFARAMIDDHSGVDIRLMSLARRKGWDIPTELGPSKKGQFDHLTRLSGAKFDARYVHIMVTDHAATVKVFEKASKEVADPDLRAFATGVLPMLRHHATMADTLKEGLEKTRQASN